MFSSTNLKRYLPFGNDIIANEELKVLTIQDPAKVMMQRSVGVNDAKMAALSKDCEKEFGVKIPLQVGHKTTSKNGSITILCTTPLTWILLSDTDSASEIVSFVQKAIGPKTTITASEMTDQYICLDIKGPKARAFLAKGCAIDLSPKVFMEGHSARTLLAQANIVIWHMGDNDFRILFDVSLSDYLGRWLKGAAEEFQH